MKPIDQLSESEKTDFSIRLDILRIEFFGGHKGNYDLEHLKSFHKSVVSSVRSDAGVLRDANPDGFLYARNTDVILPDNTKSALKTVHSKMKPQDIKRLSDVLHTLNPEKDKNLTVTEFSKKLAAVYTECDFAHPFNDVNTRVITAFLNQYSNDCGFKTPFNIYNPETEKNRNTFYIARTKSTNQLALTLLKNMDPESRQFLQSQNNRLKSFQDLSTYISSNTKYSRSYYFDKLINSVSEISPDMQSFFTNYHDGIEKAVSRHPELDGVSRLLSINMQAAMQHPFAGEEQKRQMFSDAVRGTQLLLREGHTKIDQEMLNNAIRELKTPARTQPRPPRPKDRDTEPDR